MGQCGSVSVLFNEGIAAQVRREPSILKQEIDEAKAEECI